MTYYTRLLLGHGLPNTKSCFTNLENALTSDAEFIKPNTKHLFFVTVHVSLIVFGAVLFQINENNKMKFISYISCILSAQQQIFSALDPELLGIVLALLIYEFLIIGSPHQSHKVTDHKHLLQCFTKKETLAHACIVELNYISQNSLNKKIFLFQVRICLLQICSVALLQKLNSN